MKQQTLCIGQFYFFRSMRGFLVALGMTNLNVWNIRGSLSFRMNPALAGAMRNPSLNHKLGNSRALPFRSEINLFKIYFSVKHIHTCLFFLLGLLEYSFAQNAATELSKTTQAYIAADNLSMDAEVTVYKDKNDNKGSLMGLGLIRKTKENYYSKFVTDEMISNKHCTLIIDHDDKTVTYFEAANLIKNKKNYQLPNIDSLLTHNNDSVVYIGLQNGYKHFSFYNKFSPIIQTDLFIDQKTSFVKKIVYYYADSNEEESYDMYKVMIEYKNISLKNPGSDFFSEKKYIQMQKGQPVLNANYKNYKLTIAKNEQL